MTIDWSFAEDAIRLGGVDKQRINPDVSDRQAETTKQILAGFVDRPGVILSDEVGMGKTYVALAVAASVISATKGRQGPVLVMVPSRLRRKWQREWEQFKRHCSITGSLDWIQDTYAHSPTDFFKLLSPNQKAKYHLVFTTTGCFSQTFNDPWIKLAMIRLARTRTRLTSKQKERIYRWAPNLIRRSSSRNLTKDVVRRLMKSKLHKWHQILIDEWLLDEDSEDPIPTMLEDIADKIDWSDLVTVIRESLPKRRSESIDERLKKSRGEFNEACQSIYEQWLRVSKWYSPLLILDEAHHAKNDHTKLARLFRQSSEDDVSLLRGKFQRMLFLTATPFQLGHQELIRVLKSFDAIRWNAKWAPTKSRDDIKAEIRQLADALDSNRRAGRLLDNLWGDIRPEMLKGDSVETWWERVEAQPADSWEQRLVDYVKACTESKQLGEKLLRPWAIRHNRPSELISDDGKPPCRRRVPVYGDSVLTDKPEGGEGECGLSVSSQSALPFLLTARAQGELAQTSGARAFFAEGLSSSYEAFHHTRTARGNARDMDDEGKPIKDSDDDDTTNKTIVPTSWYEDRVAEVIPSREGPRQYRLLHPKVSATVNRVVDLWMGGEKVLVFCFYRETCRALYEHIREEINARTLSIAAKKLGGEYESDPEKVQSFLTRVARRCSEAGRPFYEEVRKILNKPFAAQKYDVFTAAQKKQLIEVLTAYFRAPSFLARYLPLDDPKVQRAWELGEGRREVIEPGLKALRQGIFDYRDKSNQTYFGRVVQFLDFAVELAERAQNNDATAGDEEDEALDPFQECMSAVSVFSRPRRPDRLDDENEQSDADPDDGSYRVVPLVRIVHGQTPMDTRERLALAFNSPLFPEVLVSSGVMGEGIDLHRFCRHVIHHDGYWNPSTMEQQTGRLDRIRCKAEICHMPIRVYQPFIAGGADEKMFRVVRDRERWFQIVMGQKFKFDERESEELAQRVPIPDDLASQLTFDLARWKPK